MNRFKTLNIKHVSAIHTSVILLYNPRSAQSYVRTALHLHYNYTTQWTTDVVRDFDLITRPFSVQQNMVLVVVLV